MEGDQGIVTTLRGHKINMHELRNKAKQPLVQGDQKDKLPPQKQPEIQPTVQGFMPSMEGVARPQTKKPIPPEIVKAEQIVENDQPTAADFTGVIVDKPRRLKERPDNVEEAANAALSEIIGDLEAQKKDVAPLKSRRSLK